MNKQAIYNKNMKLNKKKAITKPKKIWFYCWNCGKYNWIDATKDTLAWYDGVETSYCPHCDDETPCDYDIDVRPIGSLLNLKIWQQ